MATAATGTAAATSYTDGLRSLEAETQVDELPLQRQPPGLAAGIAAPHRAGALGGRRAAR